MWPRGRRPGPLALGRRARQERRTDPVPPALRPAAPRRRQAPLDHVRRDLLPGGRVARRRLPRRSGGLLLPAQLRRHRPVAARRRPRARRRGDVQPRVGHDRSAQHHRPLPALRGRRPGLEPGRHLAARCSCTTPVRSSSTGCASCAATPTRPAPTSGCTPASTATRPGPSALRTSADGVVVGETEHPLAAGANEIDWSLDVDRPQLWWPHALGDQPLTEIDVEVLVDGERERPALAPHRPARGGVERLGLLGQRRAPVPEGCQPAADPARAGRRDARRGPPRRRARGRGRPRRAARAGPHRRPRAVPRRRRARDAAAAGLPAAVGLRPSDPQGGRPPGPRGGRLARPPPVDRAVVRPRRADRRGAAGRDATGGRSACAASSPSSCRRGTSRSSTAG